MYLLQDFKSRFVFNLPLPGKRKKKYYKKQIKQKKKKQKKKNKM